jgi:hypothetical protein
VLLIHHNNLLTFFPQIYEMGKKLERKYGILPEGVRIISAAGGAFYLTDERGTEVLDETNSRWHTFIDDRNLAHYLIGNENTNEQNPSNATAKISVTPSHGYFDPHAHSTSHSVMPLGPAGCLVYNESTSTGLFVALSRGQIIQIDPMVAHSFYNRSRDPLGCLIMNTGLGINEEGYAITLEIAQQMKGQDPEHFDELSKKLQELERELKDPRKRTLGRVGETLRRLERVYEVLRT